MYRIYDLPTLQRISGLSFHKVYYRLMRLAPLLASLGYPVKKAKKNKIVLSPASFKVFSRLVELERGGLNLKTCINVLESELAERREAEALEGGLPPQEETESGELSSQLQSSLVRELASLREEMRLLRRQHESLHRLFLQYLAPAAGQPGSEPPAEAEQTPAMEPSCGSNHPAKPPAT